MSVIILFIQHRPDQIVAVNTTCKFKILFVPQQTLYYRHNETCNCLRDVTPSSNFVKDYPTGQKSFTRHVVKKCLWERDAMFALSAEVIFTTLKTRLLLTYQCHASFIHVSKHFFSKILQVTDCSLLRTCSHFLFAKKSLKRWVQEISLRHRVAVCSANGCAFGYTHPACVHDLQIQSTEAFALKAVGGSRGLPWLITLFATRGAPTRFSWWGDASGPMVARGTGAVGQALPSCLFEWHVLLVPSTFGLSCKYEYCDAWNTQSSWSVRMTTPCHPPTLKKLDFRVIVTFSKFDFSAEILSTLV